MTSRGFAGTIVVTVTLLVAGTLLDLPLWQCPFAALGGSCPGCGLTRSAAQLVRGEVDVWNVHHVTVLLLVMPLLCLLAAATMPRRWVTTLTRGVAAVERMLLLWPVLFLWLTLYWLLSGW